MTIKKYPLLICLLLLTSVTFSQKSKVGGFNVFDSSVITRKGKPQQNEFLNNSYDYPAKPRSQWELGVSGGLASISGDVSSTLPAFGFAAHVRKSLGYVFSLRLQYLYGTAEGLNWQASENYSHNSAWGNYNSVNDRFVYYNYKNKTQDLGIQGIFNLNNIRFHKDQTKLLLYTGFGFGATVYQTKINALDASGNTYTNLFNQVYNTSPAVYKDRKDIIKALTDGMDDSYETDAQSKGKKSSLLGDNTLRFSSTVLAGLSYRLGKRLNIALEDRHTFVKDDLLDGQQYQEAPIGEAVLTSNWDSYNYLSLGLNFNLGKNAVEPLYWLNPLNYAYSELNNPKHMKLPKPIYEDGDGDGVVDQLDREQNTPAGSAVDTHGVTLDTDGDGVPDYKDKQLVTPTECQPVDADGVGKCPEPECCKNIKAAAATPECPCDYPSLTFGGSSTNLSTDAKRMLDNIASKMKANPTCNININGYPETSKASQANCQKRASVAKMYLVEKQGISAERIATNCEVGGGDKNTVDVKCQ